MKLVALRVARGLLTALFALFAASFVGLSVYAVLQFGLWWPRRVGAGDETQVGLHLSAPVQKLATGIEAYHQRLGPVQVAVTAE